MRSADNNVSDPPNLKIFWGILAVSLYNVNDTAHSMAQSIII